MAITVTRDTYRLRTALSVSGSPTPARRAELLAVAGKCPAHKPMTPATTEIVSELAAAGS